MTVAKFRITYRVQGREPGEVEAEDYRDHGEWITFQRPDAARSR
jgi:hypothetical protein